MRNRALARLSEDIMHNTSYLLHRAGAELIAVLDSQFRKVITPLKLNFTNQIKYHKYSRIIASEFILSRKIRTDKLY